MNEKFKKVILWLGAIGGIVLSFICGKGFNNNLNKRISDAKDSVEDSGRTADVISAGNTRAQEHAERAGQGVGNAQEAVKRGLGVIEEIGKRNNI